MEVRLFVQIVPELMTSAIVQCYPPTSYAGQLTTNSPGSIGDYQASKELFNYHRGGLPFLSGILTPKRVLQTSVSISHQASIAISWLMLTTTARPQGDQTSLNLSICKEATPSLILRLCPAFFCLIWFVDLRQDAEWLGIRAVTGYGADTDQYHMN